MDSKDRKISSLNIKSLNVNSIGKNPKRFQVFSFLKRKDADIFILTDTRLNPKIENAVKAEWGGPAYFSSFNSQKRGVAILLKKNLPINVVNISKDENGNLLCILLNFDEKNILISGVYGPNQDCPDFYRKSVFAKIEEWNPDFCVFGGDWNVVLDQTKDTLNYVNENNLQARKTILDIMEGESLTDIWRDNHTNEKLYTWFRKGEDKKRKKSVKAARLDFFLVSENLTPYVDKTSIDFSAYTDHSIISLTIDFSKVKQGKGFFKYNNSLLKNTEYIDIIKKVFRRVTMQYSQNDYDLDFWTNIPINQLQHLDININPQLFFEVLLCEIRGETIQFSSRLKKEKERENDFFLKEIKRLEILRNLDPNCSQINDDLSKVKIDYETLLNNEAQGAAIRSKAFYSLNAEKPTRFFCNLEKYNGAQKFIGKLHDSNGKLHTNQRDVENLMFNYYKTLYKKDTDLSDMSIEDYLGPEHINIKKISEQQKNTCEGLLTLDEVGSYLKKIRNNKSPGSTGFTGEFYKFFWPDFKYRLLNSMNYSYEKDILPQSQRLGVTTLIPKGDLDKSYLSSWRPITLLNTYYKLISGCISERIKPALNSIINHDQKGYLKDRYIGEITRTVFDTIDYSKRKKISGLLLLVDFSKAYDSLSFSFLEKTLMFFGFGQSLIKWVSLTLKNFSSCINHAGNVSEKFDFEKGLKQGDPLSSYLFILGSELLAIKIRAQADTAGFCFENLIHILDQYADDLTAYLKVYENDMQRTEANLRKVISLIGDFYKMSGLKVNVNKTKAIWFGEMADSNAELCVDLGLKWVKQFKLLGLNFDNKLENMFELNFEEGIKNIKKVLNSWRYRYLTVYGKITIIKSLALSKLTHLSIVLPQMEQESLNEIEKMFIDFIWNGKGDKVDRQTLFMPEKIGGLNMISVSEFWKSLKLTWLRRLLTTKSAWKSILENSLDFFNVNLNDLFLFGDKKFLKLKDSMQNPFWKDVFLATAELIENVNYTLPYKFGLMPICNNSLFKIGGHPVKQRDIGNRVDLQVWDFMDTASYRFLDLQEFNNINCTQFNFLLYHGIVNAIKKGANSLNFNIGLAELHCRPRQPLLMSIIVSQKKGCKSYYNILRGKKVLHFTLANKEKAWHDELGFLVTVDKWNAAYKNCANIKSFNEIKWMQFQILHRSLKTNRILSHFIPEISNICSFCKFAPENISHFFFSCYVVKNLWSEISNFLLPANINSTFNLSNILFSATKEKSSSVFNQIVLFTKKFIWKCKYMNIIPSLIPWKNFFLETLKDYKVMLNICNNDFIFAEEWNPIYELLSPEHE